MKVGRQMGFAVYQREDSLDDPVKRLTPPDVSRHDEKIDKAKRAIQEISRWTPHVAEIKATKYYHEELVKHNEIVQKNKDLKDRYLKMREKVEAWNPDPEVAFVKVHALRYIDESIDFDCFDDDFMGKHYGPVKRMGPQEYKDMLIENHTENIEFAAKRKSEELKRYEQASRASDKFLDSLPD